ncbi:MAG TPA: cytochrome-c oxidase, cbb3-type subunit II, partial [Chitinophagales bacterium]|nr:cytochrome-c oxidase, cbb3-type subunit II [Chitinophagales bacterium]
PHHLIYTSLPDWAQTLGVVFSFMLIAPSWGGMVNGLLTLRGAWDKVRDDVVLKFMVVAVSAYGMSTFEGPMLSLRNINAWAHFTDWIVAHVHVGALGWNGFLTFGILYWLVPRMWKTNLYSKSLANTHFWIGTLGIIFYAVPMYWAGWMEGSMWKQFNDDGMLQYPTFIETTQYVKPFYAMRSIGGVFYLTGVFIMAYNLVKTARQGSFMASEEAEAAPMEKVVKVYKGEFWHRALERRPIQFGMLALVAVLIGGIVELVPTFLVKSNVPTIASVQPYTPLELQGRDIYVREGCYTCHSQMVRPFRNEVVRYKGEYSKAGEFVYDHPFQWGSKRTGPDLHREGGKQTNAWHYWHMYEPTSMTSGSIMPSYAWLHERTLDISTTPAKIRVMQNLGVPYPEGYDAIANDDLKFQAEQIAAKLAQEDSRIKTSADKEIIALIAYLQRLGTDIKAEPTAQAAN